MSTFGTQPVRRLPQGAAPSLAVLLLVNILNFYDRAIVGALAEPLRHEFHLTDAQLGAITTVFTLVYAAVGIPIGRLADARSRKKLLATGVAIWATLTALGGWATSFLTLLVSRLGVAVGEATCAPASTSWIGDLFPPHRRSRALAIFMLAVPVGGALSFFCSGPAAQAWGWRTALVIAAAPAALLVPALLMLPEPERGRAEAAAGRHAGSLRHVLRLPVFWWIVASGVVLNFALYAFASFLPAFFGRIHHMNVGRAGVVAGIVYGLGGLSGGAISARLGDASHAHFGGGLATARMKMAACAALVSAPIAWAGFRQGADSLVFASVLIAISYAGLNAYYGFVYAALQDLVAPALRGTAMAVYFLVMYLGGASFGPMLTGKLSDLLARRAADSAGSSVITEAFKAAGLQQAMLIIPTLAIALALVLWAGSRSLRSKSQPVELSM
jgi:MFS family permease